MRRLLLSAAAIGTSLTLVAPAAFAYSGNLNSEIKLRIKTEMDVRRNQKPDLPCVKMAVEKREAAVLAAFDAFSGIWRSALLTRSSELSVAWSIENKDSRNSAVRAAWKKFRDSKKERTARIS